MLDLISAGKIYPVLVDIGAAGGAPEIWKPIASQSIYVGFDPDLRDMTDSVGGEFHHRFILNKAVTSDAGQTEVEFYLTDYPHCSSTLKPDLASVYNYSFHDYFVTNRKVRVPSISLDAALAQLKLDHIDWMKLDTQGTDLRLFRSLNEPARSRVLALDIEPSLIDTYQGEDLFIDTHRYLISNGFWLSHMDVLGAGRIRRSTLEEVVPDASLQQIFAHRKLSRTPAWCETRYFRTLESLAQRNSCRSDYALLWTFSMLAEQWGFAMDVALEYRKLFGNDEWAEAMQKSPRTHLRVPLHYSMIATAKRVLPHGVQNALRRVVGRRK
jgi:FkbM family methyltransferase